VAALVVADFYPEYISLEYLRQKCWEQSVSLRPISVVMSRCAAVSFPVVLQQVCIVLLLDEQHYWKTGRKQFSLTVVNRYVTAVLNTRQNLNTKVTHSVYRTAPPIFHKQV
jgi:hypothetical protein